MLFISISVEQLNYGWYDMTHKIGIPLYITMEMEDLHNHDTHYSKDLHTKKVFIAHLRPQSQIPR